jgi:hypothetical protein
MIAALAIGGALLLAMFGVSWWGWVTLPADARVPIHFGLTYNNFVPKRLGLVLHPAVGVLVYVVTVVATHHPTHGSKTAPVFIFPLIMCVVLAVQFGAIKVARSRSATPV